jgi:hypothetical protein
LGRRSPSAWRGLSGPGDHQVVAYGELDLGHAGAGRGQDLAQRDEDELVQLAALLDRLPRVDPTDETA